MGWFYVSTILDDFSRYIIARKLCTTMKAEDVTGSRPEPTFTCVSRMTADRLSKHSRRPAKSRIKRPT